MKEFLEILVDYIKYLIKRKKGSPNLSIFKFYTIKKIFRKWEKEERKWKLKN